MEIDKKYEWLYDEINGLKEKIRYKDKIIYRINGKLHNPVGQAIVYLQDPNEPNTTPEEGEYYISDKKLEFEEWKIYNREHKMKKIIKKE
jgi:hypothetical protein